MKKKSINLRNVSSVLSDAELKRITGGDSGEGKVCSKCWVTCESLSPVYSEMTEEEAVDAFEIHSYDCACGFLIYPC